VFLVSTKTLSHVLHLNRCHYPYFYYNLTIIKTFLLYPLSNLTLFPTADLSHA